MIWVTRLHAGACERSMPRISDGAVYLAVGGAVELIEVGLPLPGEERLLLGVAVLARGHHVGADRSAPADQRHHVIQGQRPGPHRAPAVVTDAGRDAPPFAYRDRGLFATIGRKAAVIAYRRLRLRGWFAWWLWGAAHVYFLVSLRNRLIVVTQWLWSYLLFERGARLITGVEPGSRPPA